MWEMYSISFYISGPILIFCHTNSMMLSLCPFLLHYPVTYLFKSFFPFYCLYRYIQLAFSYLSPFPYSFLFSLTSFLLLSCSWCYKTIFGGNLDFPKIKKLKNICFDVRTCTKMWKQCYFQAKLMLKNCLLLLKWPILFVLASIFQISSKNSFLTSTTGLNRSAFSATFPFSLSLIQFFLSLSFDGNLSLTISIWVV